MTRETINALKVCPGKRPYRIEIEAGLSSLQKQVGGFIEAVYPFEESVAVIYNEESKINGLPFNRSLKDKKGNIYDIICGDFLIAGVSEDSFCSLSQELMVKYEEYFKMPEMLLNDLGSKNVFIFPYEEVEAMDESM